MVLGLKQLKLAAGILAGVAKAGDQTGIATAIDLALKAADLGGTLRKQDPVAVALRDVSAKLEEATRKALSGEFGADWENKPDLAATLAALPDVLEATRRTRTQSSRRTSTPNGSPAALPKPPRPHRRSVPSKYDRRAVAFRGSAPDLRCRSGQQGLCSANDPAVRVKTS